MIIPFISPNTEQSMPERESVNGFDFAAEYAGNSLLPYYSKRSPAPPQQRK